MSFGYITVLAALASEALAHRLDFKDLSKAINNDLLRTGANSTGGKLCCAWKVDLGSETYEIDIYNENRRKPGTTKWDFSSADAICNDLDAGAKYSIQGSRKSQMDGYQFQLTKDCKCGLKKGPYGGKPVGQEGVKCSTSGPLGAAHCSTGPYEQVFACLCVPATMICAPDRMSMLFAPVVKDSGMMYNCGSPFDKNAVSAHYISALATAKAVESDAGVKQKMLAKSEGSDWEYRDKYGGQALAEKQFCPSASA